MVAVGSGQVEADQGLVATQVRSATMEVPAPQEGRVLELCLAVGDGVTDALVARLEVSEVAASTACGYEAGSPGSWACDGRPRSTGGGACAGARAASSTVTAAWFTLGLRCGAWPGAWGRSRRVTGSETVAGASLRKDPQGSRQKAR